MSEVQWEGLVRTRENGSRRSRTLRPQAEGDESAQVQAKVATIIGGGKDGRRFMQVRWWTEESESWTHMITDTRRPGLAGIQSVGHGRTEAESWKQCADSFFESTGIRL
jgi:hypothetical protein